MNVYSPPNIIEAAGVGGAYGDSAATMPGKPSKGVVQVRASTLLCVSIRLDTKEGWYTGYENVFPADEAYSIMLGDSGSDTKSLVVMAPQAGSLGNVFEAPNVFWGTNAYPGGSES